MPMVSGALKPSDFVDPLSLNTKVFATVPSPRMVIGPVIVVAPPLIVPVVSIKVVPLISELPVKVPPVITGLVKVLLVKVWLASAVTTTPDAGNVAVEFTPIPPRFVGKIPVTAVGCARFTALKYGEPPLDGTVRLWYAVPAGVEYRLPASLPRMTPLLVKLLDPVPPKPTPSMPVPMMDAGRAGISAAISDAP